jgi:hypothetical protein
MLFFNPFSSNKKDKIVQSGTSAPDQTISSIAPLIYPPEMRGDVTRPCMVFTAHERKLNGQVQAHRIWFPAPANIAFDDGADYGPTNLDFGANVVASKFTGQKGFGDLFKEITSTNARTAATLASKALPADLQAAANLTTRQINNPNTNTTFNNNTVRDFEFAFKMVARSQSESDLIRRIQSKFRHFMYASRGSEGSTITLDYPPVWTIKFMNMDSGTENPFIPRIYTSYCTSVNTNFNSTGNVYFTDNAPLEVDLQISFQETRALNRHDIEFMQKDQLGTRGLDENGMGSLNAELTQPDPAPTKGG